MAIVGQENVASARTTFETLVDSALENQREQGLWQAFATRREGAGSNAYAITLPGATPTYAEWTGDKSIGGFRKLTQTYQFKKYHKTLDLQRSDVVNDKDGSTAQAMRRFVGDVGYFADKLVFDSLNSNPTCIDGLALLHDSHLYGSGGATWDNKSANALSHAEFNTWRANMRKFTDEYGEPLGVEPNILLVNPDEERIALEIAQADSRPVSVSTAGAYASGGAAGATSIANVYRGIVDVVVTSRWTSGNWLLVDSRFPPAALIVWRDPEVHISDDMSGYERMMRDRFIYSVEGDAVAGGLQPWGCAGKIA